MTLQFNPLIPNPAFIATDTHRHTQTDTHKSMNDDAFYFPGEIRQSGHFTGMPCLMVPLSEHQAAQESSSRSCPQLSAVMPGYPASTAGWQRAQAGGKKTESGTMNFQF